MFLAMFAKKRCKSQSFIDFWLFVSDVQPGRGLVAGPVKAPFDDRNNFSIRDFRHPSIKLKTGNRRRIRPLLMSFQRLAGSVEIQVSPLAHDPPDSL
jgi:hypothetical protein